jgi:hypothetical protein
VTEWFEDESFWEALYPFLFPADRFEADMREFVRTDAFDLPLHGVSSRRPPADLT